MNTTPELIDSLSRDLRPVARSRPPLATACIWLTACVAAVAIAATVTGAWPLMLARLGDHRLALELAATLATGIAGTLAAFMLAFPDRARAWALLPLPFLALWLATSGYGCYRNWLVTGANGLKLGRSADCFFFIVAASVPMAIALWLALRRAAAALDPLRVTATAGIGIAALAAAALQFWHPFDVTVADLASHAAAVTIVCAAMISIGPRRLALA